MVVVIVLVVLLWPTLLHPDVREVPCDPGCCRPEQIGLVVWGSLEQRTVMLLCCYPRVCMGAGPRGRPHHRAHCKRMGAAARATHELGLVSPADQPLSWLACVLGSQNRGRQTARTETDRMGWKQLPHHYVPTTCLDVRPLCTHDALNRSCADVLGAAHALMRDA